MRNLLRCSRALCATAAIVVAISCDHSPTTPTLPLTSPVVPVPVVTSISSVVPAEPDQSSVAQVLNVTGAGFQAGLVLQVTAPGGATTVVGGTDIQGVALTSFQVRVTLAEIGRYGLVVRQTNGDISTPFPLDVRQAAATDPVIDSVSPAIALLSSAPSTVSLVGHGFDPSLIVQVIDPDSQLVEWDAAHRPGETTTLIEFSLVFAKAGNYRISLWNAVDPGPASNTVIVQVR